MTTQQFTVPEKAQVISYCLYLLVHTIQQSNARVGYIEPILIYKTCTTCSVDTIDI